MQIPYYLKQRITHHVLNVVTLILLVLTLLPIGWMLYASLKENTDILVGKVSLSRAKTIAREISVDNKYIYLCTADGGINRFDRLTSKPAGYVSASTSATHFAFDDKYIWVSASNRGLVRISKDNIKDKKEFKLPLKNVDPSKVADTIIIRDKDDVWYTMRYRGFEGLMKFSLTDGMVTQVFDLTNDLSPLQIMSMVKVGDIIWVGTDKALLKVDANDGKVLKTYQTSTLLSEGVSHLLSYDGKIFFSGSTGLFEFSPATFSVIRKYGKETGLLSSQVESIVLNGSKLLVGTNTGLSVLDLVDGRIKDIDLLFNDVSLNGDAIPNTFVAGVVTSVSFYGNLAFVGSTNGRMSIVDEETGKVTGAFMGKKGALVVAWRNYLDMWKNINFGLYLRNSFFICGMSMIFSMIIATLSAYAVSRFKFPGSNLFSVSILATQMIPGIMFLIPIYVMFVNFTEFTGIPLKGTFFGIIFMYTAFNVPFSIWILRSFFAAIPIELEEAARIDGCNPLQVFWYIVLPLAVPGIIATGVYIFLNAWDELMFAWVLTSGDTMTIPVGIRNFVGNYQNRFDLMMAAATVATLPVLFVFFLLQKYIVRGLTAGAVKG